MGITMRNNEFAKGRNDYKYGRRRSPMSSYEKRAYIGDSIALFIANVVPILIAIWWQIKIAAVVVFVMAIIPVVGALLNNNQPHNHDIVWAIIGFIAIFVL